MAPYEYEFVRGTCPECEKLSGAGCDKHPSFTVIVGETIIIPGIFVIPEGRIILPQVVPDPVEVP